MHDWYTCAIFQIVPENKNPRVNNCVYSSKKKNNYGTSEWRPFELWSVTPSNPLEEHGEYVRQVSEYWNKNSRVNHVNWFYKENCYVQAAAILNLMNAFFEMVLQVGEVNICDGRPMKKR